MITAKEAVRKSQDLSQYLEEVSEVIEMACECGNRSTNVTMYGNFNVDALILEIKGRGFSAHTVNQEMVTLPNKRVWKVTISVAW